MPEIEPTLTQLEQFFRYIQTAQTQYCEAVLDSMSDGALVCDSAMHVTKFNTAAEQITEVSPFTRDHSL